MNCKQSEYRDFKYDDMTIGGHHTPTVKWMKVMEITSNPCGSLARWLLFGMSDDGREWSGHGIYDDKECKIVLGVTDVSSRALGFGKHPGTDC